MKRRTRTKATSVGVDLRTLASQYEATARSYEDGSAGRERDSAKAIFYNGRAEGLRDAADKIDGASAVLRAADKIDGALRDAASAFTNGAPPVPPANGPGLSFLVRLRDVEVRLESLARFVARGLGEAPKEPPMRNATGILHAEVHHALRQPPVKLPRTTVHGGSDSAPLGAGEIRILAALAQTTMPRSTEDLAAITGFAARTVRNQLIVLRGHGCAKSTRDGHLCTDFGRPKVSGHPPLPVGDALVQEWLKKLPEGEARVLDLVAERSPGDVDVAQITVGLAARTVRNVIIALVRRCLLVRSGRGRVHLAGMLAVR